MGDTSRFLFSTLAGFFFLFLGVFAIVQNTRSRLHQSFALYCFSAAIIDLVGFVLFFEKPVSLYLYRAFYIIGGLSHYFLVRYIQDFMAVYDRRSSKIIRGIVLFGVAVLVVVGLSDGVVKDIGFTIVDGVSRFVRVSGPMVVPSFALSAALFVIVFGMTLLYLREFSGIKRNQLKFIVFGLCLYLLSILFHFISSVWMDLPSVYFSFQVGTGFCLAYAIFKYQLFEFNVWMRRIAIFAGVYLTLIHLPFFFFFPFRKWLLSHGDSLWLGLSLTVILYGLLFSMAPALVSYLNMKAEKKRWATLREQLEFVRLAAERLADEIGLSLPLITQRTTEIIKEFYCDKIRNEPRHILVSAMGVKDSIFLDGYPKLQIAESVLQEFLDTLKKISRPVFLKPFTELTIDQEIREESSGDERISLSTLKSYMDANSIELCCPCIHDGRLQGVIIMGAKASGVYSVEEMATLHLLASDVATAVRKSELLTRTQELKDLDHLKRNLIANITHEFKTPLALIHHAVDALVEDAEKGGLAKEAIDAYSSAVRSNAERLSVFIQNLLDIARIEQARIELDLENCDLASILQEAIRLFEPVAREKGVRLVLSSESKVDLVCDREKIKQIVFNLLSNAVKFTKEGEIHCSTKQKDGRITIAVQDTGPGIDGVYLSSIFDRFFQVPQDNRRSFKGTGLGLAIAKGWTEAHGGRIWAESKGLGKGSIFFVELPLEPEMPAEDAVA